MNVNLRLGEAAQNNLTARSFTGDLTRQSTDRYPSRSAPAMTHRCLQLERASSAGDLIRQSTDRHPLSLSTSDDIQVFATSRGVFHRGLDSPVYRPLRLSISAIGIPLDHHLRTMEVETLSSSAEHDWTGPPPQDHGLRTITQGPSYGYEHTGPPLGFKLALSGQDQSNLEV
ncbi:unnamed protein product [Zymoseptoria tritici ST99CH_1E4]|uniref:Uncharacterized protein n=1 Tax=Zymoseptoria tritici ST99CH_1E4 TaxID=1276532 RepID=A0A2H1FZM3_ZYMTR|nr:unnamed protein product [Zymoseptoria tritici ST99CH_1E4]